ncbi:hypothetical protein [Methanococcoides sp. FTZ1]|uniref:hypothetical protein n=1 Tax=Methanococcoides sp. FTZ1 TaxID=3439061 RepID=UPI003F84EF75
MNKTIWLLLHNLSVSMLGYDPAVQQIKAWELFEHQISTARISKPELKELIRKQISSAAENELDGSDADYKLVDLTHFKKWLALNPTDQR